MTTPLIDDMKTRLQHSVLLRMLFLGFLALILQVPILQIESTISERAMTREYAIRDVTGTWGDRQTLAGPLVVVPYRERWKDDKGAEHVVTKHAYFQPETLVVKGQIATERRYRGIFEVPLYLATLDVTGSIRQPDFSQWAIDPKDILWDAASVVVGISDPKAIRSQVELTWNGKQHAFEPGRDNAFFLPSGINIPRIPLRGGPEGGLHQFSLSLTLGGSGYLHFLPFGRDTQVELASAWPDPSFTGAYLPATREVGEKGFTAKWHVPHLGRNFPQSWLNDEVKEPTLTSASFGVSFLSPVDAYTATNRSVKYQILFVMLTFLVFYLFELFYRLRIHPVQYLLVGFALCLFYLLLLALSEHIGFGTAYLVASASVVAVTGGYCAAILGKRRMALIVTGQLMVLYGFLFVLLQVQDYALLVGSVGLFLVLTAVMFVTRKIDWYRIGHAGGVDKTSPLPATGA